MKSSRQRQLSLKKCSAGAPLVLKSKGLLNPSKNRKKRSTSAAYSVPLWNASLSWSNQSPPTRLKSQKSQNSLVGKGRCKKS